MTEESRAEKATDSITWGYGSSDWNGYRQSLLSMLDGNHVEFIGSGHTGQMLNNANEGRPGERLNQTLKSSSHTLHQRPNVILLNIANNDIAFNDDLDTAPTRLRALFDGIYEICPDALIVVSPLGPSSNHYYQARMNRLNKAIPSILDDLLDQKKHGIMADTSSISVGELFDDLHYRDQGYAKLARAFYEAMDVANFKGWIKEPIKVEHKKLVLSTACESPPDWIKLPSVFAGFNSPPSDTRYLWADIDGNGRADFLVLAPDGQLQPYLNFPQSMPEPGKVIEWHTDKRYYTLANTANKDAPILLTSDLTGSNLASLIYVYPNGSIFATSNAGPNPSNDESTFKTPVLIADTDQAPADPLGIRFADFDGDGRDDLAYLTPTGILQVWLNKANLYQHSSTEPDPTALNINWIPQGQIVGAIPGISRSDIRLADINGDGLADFLLVDPEYGAVEGWLNKGLEEWYRTAAPESEKLLSIQNWDERDPNSHRSTSTIGQTTPRAQSAIDAAKGAARDLVNFWISSFSSRAKSNSSTPARPSHRLNTNDQYPPNPKGIYNGGGGGPPSSLNTQRTPWRWDELGVIAEGAGRGAMDDVLPGAGAPGIQFADIAGSRRASYLYVEKHGEVWGFGNGCGSQGMGWGWGGD